MILRLNSQIMRAVCNIYLMKNGSRALYVRSVDIRIAVKGGFPIVGDARSVNIRNRPLHIRYFMDVK